MKTARFPLGAFGNNSEAFREKVIYLGRLIHEIRWKKSRFQKISFLIIIFVNYSFFKKYETCKIIKFPRSN